MIAVTLPLHTQSENNAREHHMARARRRKAQRMFVALKLKAKLRGSAVAPPFIVTLTRIAPRKLDGDNLQGAMKAIRDQVADELGIDDGDEAAAEWRYSQRKATLDEAKARTTVLGCGIEIRIEPRGTPSASSAA